ncbi:hypothetical protein CC2G_007786 [Coprinopsis cinerea AmutBmut pab1-1]|nr:hypothetical protein CC2G_007786 [Coprinopsis cinerea AmutBmut pab1-1]
MSLDKQRAPSDDNHGKGLYPKNALPRILNVNPTYDSSDDNHGKEGPYKQRASSDDNHGKEGP